MYTNLSRRANFGRHDRRDSGQRDPCARLTANLAARFADALYPLMDEADLLSARPACTE